MNKIDIRSTTIIGVRHNRKVALAGDGQVTFGDMAFKQKAVKVREFVTLKNTVLGGFAGAAADALTLFEKFEQKLEQYEGDLKRSIIELANHGFYVVALDAFMHGERISEPFVTGNFKDKQLKIFDIVRRTAKDIEYLYNHHYYTYHHSWNVLQEYNSFVFSACWGSLVLVIATCLCIYVSIRAQVLIFKIVRW